MIYDLYQEYYYFRPGITLDELVVSSSLVLLVLLVLHLMTKYKWKLMIVSGLIVEYLFIMLSITIFHRGVVPEIGISIIPLAFISDICAEPYLISEKLNNLLLFIPLGILLSSLKPTDRKLRTRSVTFVGCATSLCIELTQLITHRGVFETDDIICNTLGCAVGAMIAKTLFRLIGKVGGR